MPRHYNEYQCPTYMCEVFPLEERAAFPVQLSFEGTVVFSETPIVPVQPCQFCLDCMPGYLIVNGNH